MMSRIQICCLTLCRFYQESKYVSEVDDQNYTELPNMLQRAVLHLSLCYILTSMQTEQIKQSTYIGGPIMQQRIIKWWSSILTLHSDIPDTALSASSISQIIKPTGSSELWCSPQSFRTVHSKSNCEYAPLLIQSLFSLVDFPIDLKNLFSRT